MAGLVYAMNEAAFRLEIIVGSIMVVLSCILRVTATEHILLIGSVLLVLIVEILNTAIEAAADDTSLALRELAKRAKDLGSAAVFIALINCGLCWAYILLANWDGLLG